MKLGPNYLEDVKIAKSIARSVMILLRSMRVSISTTVKWLTRRYVGVVLKRFRRKIAEAKLKAVLGPYIIIQFPVGMRIRVDLSMNVVETS